MMYAKFMALPFFARRLIIAMASLFVMWVCAYLPKSGLTQVLIGSGAFIIFWATGLLMPFLKVTFFVLRWRLWYVVRYK
ncbi:hypothetical protein [Caballeronia sp. INML2]|jgi:hypothetical protein|uniref:hypothetical protein n=1 Tax=Caballeronia sp. INML2 TaxID=2921748 RepID=UPI0020295736|nr:hypothetical protein [Caballeronia sp. INML2]